MGSRPSKPPTTQTTNVTSPRSKERKQSSASRNEDTSTLRFASLSTSVHHKSSYHADGEQSTSVSLVRQNSSSDQTQLRGLVHVKEKTNDFKSTGTKQSGSSESKANGVFESQEKKCLDTSSKPREQESKEAGQLEGVHNGKHPNRSEESIDEMQSSENQFGDTKITNVLFDVENLDGQLNKTDDTETESKKSTSISEHYNPEDDIKIRLTDKEADEEIESLLTECKKRVQVLNKIHLTPSEGVPVGAQPALVDITKLYSSLKDTSLKKQVECRRQLGKCLDDGGAGRKMCDIAVHLHKRGYKDSDCDYQTYLYTMQNLLNYSDITDSLTVTMVEHPNFLSHIRETLNTHQHNFELDGTAEIAFIHFIVDLLIGVVHNIATKEIDENIRRLREEKLTDALMPYLKTKHDVLKLISIATLAAIVDEKESELLQTDTSAIKFLVKTLRLGMDSGNRRIFGWSTQEIARAIGYLARNEANKKTLADFGAIPLLLELSKSESDTQEEEMKDAVQAIWALSFDDDNKLTIVNTEGLIDRLLELRKHSSKSIRHSCNGVLWTLRDTLKNTSKYSNIVTKLFQSDEKSISPAKKVSSKTEINNQGHIMISYQWANQKTLLDVSSHLKAHKLTVWMDVEDMEGSTLQAMAEAIENARVVLVCMSQKYKDSPNCRAEAEYAFQKRKIIIPLVMERGYRPDGWLGMIMGSKLFFDFSGKYPFESKIGGLLKEVEKTYRPLSRGDTVDGSIARITPDLDTIEKQVIHPQRAPVASAPPSTGNYDEKVKKWTEDEVKIWSQENNIKRVNLNEITGEELLSIRNLRHEAPEFFYKLLQENLQLSSVKDLFTFVNALNKL